MKHRRILLVALTVAVLGLAVLGSAKKERLLLLDWSAKAPAESSPVALLIELGLKDEKPATWVGSASVSGGKIVQREGYRFKDGDKLVDPDAWEVSTHRQGQRPAAARRNLATGAAWVGIVLHVADLQPDATLTLQGKGENVKPVTVPLREVLAGQKKLVWDGAASVQRVSAATPLVMAETEDDFPAAAYGPDGSLWVAYISYTLKDTTRKTPKNQLDQQPESFQSFYRPEYGDQLFVKVRRDGKWGEPIAVTDPHQDLMRCAVAVDGSGVAWVGYSAHRDGQFHLYVRPIDGKKAGTEQQLTHRAAPDLTPAMCTDANGKICLACQSWSEDARARIRVFTGDKEKWSETATLGDKANGNCWYAALAAGPNGQVAVAYDAYQDGDYDVHVALLEGGRVTDHAVATSPRFEARPSVAYDGGGRLWIAFEDGPEGWGHDFGALDKKGEPLYSSRSVRVVCLEGDKLFKPVDLPAETRPARPANVSQVHLAYPKLGIDSQGRLYLSYRQRLVPLASTPLGTGWITQVRRLDGDHWTPAVDLLHSDGLLDSRPVLLPHAGGGVLVVHNTDGRHATPGTIDDQIYVSVLDLPGEPAEPQLSACEAGQKASKDAAGERANVERIRSYRVEANSKTLQPLRGEFHRHSEISGDGGNDGSLEDLWRYAIDCAEMDWLGDGDHDLGGGREYSWWLAQKLMDAYFVAAHFTPMFTYERSVPYPHGHRNPMFAKRGIMTLPRLREPDASKQVAGISANDTKMLYRYLHELGGICASHTSATGMGTDWRDNDPEVEPFVEIYQGDRNSYEYEDAPRSGHDPKGNKLPASLGGWQPAGFIINALKTKGYRLGFESSSDHISTHISYGIVLAERHDREAIVAACKQRHTYAATDNIILDVRSGSHLMGDEFTTSAAPSLQIHVIGTAPVARIDVLKDSAVVQTLKPGQKEYKGDWTDPQPSDGMHYYYVRVEQADEELAWASPMWIHYAK